MSEEKATEIWSTRLQRELLTLTTDNGDLESTEAARSMLPPWVTVKDHVLNLNNGDCNINVEIEIMKADQEQPGSHVKVRLDTSLAKKDGKVIDSAPCYPFLAPTPILMKGQELFPSGSTIQNGDQIAMDLDWTPSLHLTDAILNIGLKIRESILQGEPFHPAPEAPVSGKLSSLTAQSPTELTRGASRFASSFTKKASSSISKAFGSSSQQQQQQQQQKPDQRTAAQAARASKQRKPNNNKKTKQQQQQQQQPSTPGEVKIGDEINLVEEPWVAARGIYSCKAVRRPPFVEEAIAKAAQVAEQQSFSTPTAMLRSFTQSARSVLEESFLMITDTHIIELKTSKLSSSGTVVFAIRIDLMAKLKFRRQESLSLFFKPSPADPLVYMCPDSGDAVHQIQTVLKQHGVRGKHTNAAAYRAINDAMQLVQEIQTKELALKHDPTVHRVNEIMDLYRQAAERFEVAGDIRHEEVVTHLRKFLALPLTTSILDGSFKKPEQPKPSPTKDGKVEGEVLERSEVLLRDDELADSSVEKEKANDKAFEENVDNLLKEAKADFEKMMSETDEGDGGTLSTDAPSLDSDDKALDEVAADLDAMMREADKELAELMKA